jgi:glycosyltransferase involved in cell wall biosynthesis
MLLTIAIPTYRRHNLLRKAVLSALNQKTETKYELLIVDNDPTSDFEFLLHKFVSHSLCKVRYIRNESNIGMFANWNKCIAEARGQWVTILSDDDMLHEQYVEAISKYLSNEISCIAVEKKDFKIGENIKLDAENNLNKCVYKINKFLFNIFNPIGTPTGFAFRRELALKIGAYDLNYYPSSDYKFAKDLAEHGDVLKIKSTYAFTGIGVNESMNISTLKSFYSCDLKIRNLRPRLINKIVGVLNIVEQAHKFKIMPSKIFNSYRFMDVILLTLGLIFRAIKRTILMLNSTKAFKHK